MTARSGSALTEDSARTVTVRSAFFSAARAGERSAGPRTARAITVIFFMVSHHPLDDFFGVVPQEVLGAAVVLGLYPEIEIGLVRVRDHEHPGMVDVDLDAVHQLQIFVLEVLHGQPHDLALLVPGAGDLAVADVDLVGDLAQDVADAGLLPGQHLQYFGDGVHGVEGGLEFGEYEPPGAVPHEADAFLLARAHDVAGHG